MWTWLAVAAVLIVIYIVFFSGPRYDTYPSTSYVGNGVDTSGGNFVIFKDANDIAQCQSACSGESWCKGYTFINDNGTTKCIGVKNIKKGNTLTGGNYASGVKTQGYAPKLMHLFGSESAGKSESYIPAPATRLEFMDGAMAAPKVNEFLTMNAPATRLEFMDGSAMAAPRVNEFLTMNAPATRLEFMDGAMPAPATRVEFITGSDPYANTNAADYSVY